MSGGAGDDLYYVDNSADQIFEILNNGTDTVIASVDYTLSNYNLENLILNGDADLNATGNIRANCLLGNDGDNTLNGGMGDDTLGGGHGDDLLIGGYGNDLYLFGRGDGHDLIDDRGSILDRNSVQFTNGINQKDLLARLDGNTLHLFLRDDPTDSLSILHWRHFGSQPISNFTFSDGSHLSGTDLNHLLEDGNSLPIIA